MRIARRTVALIFSGLAAASSAAAQLQTFSVGPHLNVTIPDGAYRGTRQTMGCSTLTVPANVGITLSEMSVAFGVEHTFAGDLTMKLYNPAGRYVTLLSRPGVNELADDGSTPAGENGVFANFSPSYLVTMFDATERDGEQMGATLRDDQAIGNFMLPTPALFRPNAGAAGGDGSLSAFNGASPAGVWTLCVGDAVVGDSGFIDYWQMILRATTSACVPDARTLCLNRPGADTEGRFRVTATWETPNGASGTAQAIRLTNDTGYFWFFSETNVETVVKVLDGCLTNNRFWVFAGGLTDVNVTITVEDTRTGARKTYSNPQGTAFLPIQDTQAFATCL